ncbi:hypothetical protein GCM10027275_11290 [Rhabdobacter roseus]|uniref:Tetratricopeptide (TPR) repeat protein n=1 Tax=Rhabdobacter roseus TaxID=1655419 RepID=A0A840TSQ9_9BACT|nr:tetratricopeptide repeat protein [Rhabdobacter roseus]MBB5283040.1 tetratricopeptide (TPR) repeat protein [Rhabdobacter roseus]
MKTELEYSEEAKHLRDTNRVEEAFILVDHGLSFYPKSAILFFRKGTLYSFIKDYGQAIYFHNHSIYLDPAFASPEYGLGSVYHDLKEYDRAIHHHEQAIKKDPNDANPEHGLGNTYLALKEYDRAIHHYEQAIQMDPNDAYPEFGLGNVYLDLKHYSRAIQHYNQAIQKEPNFAHPEERLGTVYHDLKDFTLAILHYEQAIQNDPDFAAPEHGMGNVYHDLQDYPRAIHHYEQAIQKDPDLAAPEHGLGNVYRALQDYPRAIHHYEQAIQKDPDYAHPEHGMGNVYHDLQDYPRAIHHYEQAIQKDLNDAYPENGLGNVYRALKDYPRAIHHYEQAIQKNPNFAYPEHGLGNVYLDLKHYSLGIQHYNQAIQKDPDSGLPEYGLGITYYNLKEYSHARIHLTRCIFLDSSLATGVAYQLVPIFDKEIPCPYLVLHLVRIVPETWSDLTSIVQRAQAQSRTVQLYQTYLKNYSVSKESQKQYKYLEALINYFMGLPFEAYRIFGQEIDSSEDSISLMGNYYWLQAATAFAIPDDTYNTLKENAISDAYELLSAPTDASAQELYYAAQILWNEFLSKNDPKFAEQADRAFQLADEASYLPAAYMRVLTLGTLNRTEEQAQKIAHIISLELSDPDGPAFLRGFEVQNLDPSKKDFLTPILKYAHFTEIIEAIELVSEGPVAKIPEFYQAWHMPNLEEIRIKVEKVELENLKSGLLNSFVEKVGSIYNTERANKLKEEIDFIDDDLQDSIERIFTKYDTPVSSEGYSTDLEFELATFIHKWRVAQRYRHDGGVMSGRIVYEKVIAYFMHKGILEPLSAFSLTYYAFFIQERHKPKNLYSIFSSASLEGTTDIGKEALAGVGKTIISTTLEIGSASLSPVTFFVGFMIKTILQHRALFSSSCLITLSAKDDYNTFKRILDENTLELVKQYRPKDPDEQGVWEQICRWYDERSL